MKCPNCGNENPHRIAGYEIRGVYDGVLFWICQECGRAFSRNWTGFGRRQEIADEEVRRWNEEVEREQGPDAGSAGTAEGEPDLPSS